MVSFQLFILECYKVQDTLRKMYMDNLCNLQIKVELQQALEIENIQSSVIKSEVWQPLSHRLSSIDSAARMV